MLATRLVEPVFAVPQSYGAWDTLLAVYGYAAQIYCDFSGYTDIAIGCALLLGYRFPRNFNAPYTAVDPQEFWRRWHISLSSWLRDYLYFPLGGSRKGKLRTYINLMVTMLLGGLWHGAAWTFVVWGGLHGFYLLFIASGRASAGPAGSLARNRGLAMDGANPALSRRLRGMGLLPVFFVRIGVPGFWQAEGPRGCDPGHHARDAGAVSGAGGPVHAAALAQLL